MAVNELSFNQIATVLNSIVAQATGTVPQAVTDTSSFVTVAQTALKTGYDPLATAISQVLSKTIFSVRPYNRKFAGLEVSNQRFGNHVRKLNPIDSESEEDDRLKLVDGQSVDQYVVKKPLVQQTNFYGANTWQRHMTVYRDQLDSAFSGPEQLGSFLGMMMSNANDQIEQAHEQTARMTVANLIGGAIDAGSDKSVVHCLTEYNAANGTSLTAAEVLSAENINGFAKWLVAKVQTVADMLTERSTIYHMTIDDKPISRHTPISKQKMYMYADYLNKVDANTLSMAFHDNYLKQADVEKVNFWQSIETPQTINVTPGYTGANGAVVKGAAVNAPILAALFDEETAGYTVVNQWAQPTPFNARGGYYNQYWHFTDRYWNDFTENHVVFVLD